MGKGGFQCSFVGKGGVVYVKAYSAELYEQK